MRANRGCEAWKWLQLKGVQICIWGSIHNQNFFVFLFVNILNEDVSTVSRHYSLISCIYRLHLSIEKGDSCRNQKKMFQTNLKVHLNILNQT